MASFSSASSSTPAAAAAATPSFPPCSFVIGDDGRKWRLAVAAAVMNTKGELLVGERIDRPGAWQLPQGGVDQGESVVEAASRELFEEMGVEDGHHVEFVGEVPSDVSSELRYEVAGGWLKENGYAGQELRFVLFRTVSAGLEGHTPTGNNGAGAGAEAAAANSPSPVRLTGLGGEPAEFSAAKWTPLEEVVAAAWENKRPAYEKALSVWAARRDPQFVDVARRHLRYPAWMRP